MSKQTVIRVILDIILATCVVNSWWFIALPLIVICSWFLPYFIESIVAGIAFDSLFGMMPGIGIWAYAGTIVSIMIFIIMNGARKLMR